MRKLVLASAVAFLACSLSACYAGAGGVTKVPGLLYSDYNYAENGSGSVSKVGSATCKSYLGFIADGDCSVRTAARNGGISEVGSVSRKVKNILGLYAEYTTVVTGR